MGRPQRITTGNVIYHVLNRSNGGGALFHKPQDYKAFEDIMGKAIERTQMRLLSYCVMPNHWHLVVWPREDSDLSRFSSWLTLTHTQRWHAHYQTVGSGHLYQGRFKSFPIQEDGHFVTVCRYVERNALRAGLVEKAEDWQWSSLHRRHHGRDTSFLSAWPMAIPEGWVEYVNYPQTSAELEVIRQSVKRNTPYGSERWLQSLSTDRNRVSDTLFKLVDNL